MGQGYYHFYLDSPASGTRVGATFVDQPGTAAKDQTVIFKTT
jgi:hypothetical protein